MKTLTFDLILTSFIFNIFIFLTFLFCKANLFKFYVNFEFSNFLVLIVDFVFLFHGYALLFLFLFAIFC
jgi:hypothetical protein